MKNFDWDRLKQGWFWCVAVLGALCMTLPWLTAGTPSIVGWTLTIIIGGSFALVASWAVHTKIPFKWARVTGQALVAVIAGVLTFNLF